MDPRSSRGAGWVAYSAIVLTIAGIFGIIDGLMAVYKSSFFTTNAVYVFSDLRAWGWITFGLGVAGVASGLAVVSGREWARWLGVFVAGLSAIGQLMFAQAYPLWSLMIMALDFLVIYGLVAYGGRREAAGALSSSDTRQTSAPADRPVTDMSDQSRRAA